MAPLSSRTATVLDAARIAAIYNEGIEDRSATFATDAHDEAHVRGWFEGSYPIVVVEDAGRIVGFASSSASSGRCCFAKNADFSVYVAREARGRGVGSAAMKALIELARARGFAKLLSGVFPENAASRALLRKMGFREVGTYERHGKLDGVWRDVVLVERLL
jgi:L-amino acid N-acyltransferase YncA